MPLIFPSHQGLILPFARRWPDRFDALALSVGATMPDIVDSVRGFLLNGYYDPWYGHTLIGVISLDLSGGLLLTWFTAVLSARFLRSKTVTPGNMAHVWQTKPSLWCFSLVIGILSHLGFDLFAHDTNLLFLPWYSDVRWFPKWWYAKWFEIRIPLMFAHPYAVGLFSITSCILSFTGIFLFYRYFRLKNSTQDAWSPKFDNHVKSGQGKLAERNSCLLGDHFLFQHKNIYY